MYKKVLIISGHILFWILGLYVISKVFGVASVEVYAERADGAEEVVVTYKHNFIRATIVTVVLSAVVFYSNIFVFLKTYFINKKLVPYIIKIWGLTLLLVLSDILLNKYLNYPQIKNGTLYFPSMGVHMGLFVFYIALSFAYAFTIEWYKSEKLKNEIAKENISSELSFLKSQINPHFLFNTLNNLYSIAQKHQISELSAGIQELSNLMRYMLYESNAEFVLLQNEVDYIESFIAIQQLRLDEEDELMVNFEKKGEFGACSIAPMILLPFVENAFKHGFSLNESSVIHITLKVLHDGIYFKIRNKAFKQHSISDKNAGIGLENVTRRLHLIYPGKHHLKIYETDGYFTAELRITTNG
ncbi:Histidine kinase [Saccharicrinis carchari]|uniref:Histidine kinase n=1 Tax=Saccharicrinis carchari TaxID=1168039 RepID=A0A521ECD1_SACCC|nr:sensor histidine kinase [Saccharicrinis carchari]SMO81594.1 Histidine kinase [Saccharicrinis carchari]